MWPFLSCLMMPWVTVDLTQPPDLMWTISGSMACHLPWRYLVIHADLVDVGEYDRCLSPGETDAAVVDRWLKITPIR